MPIEVQVGAILQRKLGGAKSAQTEGKNVRQVLENLDARYPGFKAQIITEPGELHRFVSIFLNGEDIHFMNQLDTPVKDGDTITILPSIAGG